MKMKAFFTLLAVTGFFFSTSCQESTKRANMASTVTRDTSITTDNSFSEVFFDSTLLEKFILQNKIPDASAVQFRDFYNARNYQYGWFHKNGLNETARNFWSIQSGYISYSGDSSLYNPFLQSVMDSLLVDSSNFKLPDTLQTKTELELTRQFYRYADRAYRGNENLKLADLDWFIPRKKVDLIALLDSVVRDNGKNLSDLEPVNVQYNRLKGFLLKYYGLQQKPDWKIISTEKKKLQEGDRDAAVCDIKTRLKFLGDFDESDTTSVFTASLTEAVKKYQGRYGLKEDGIVGGALLKEMNRPIEQRIRQILINMERIRWVPAQPTTDYILVNIPEFKLHAYENGNYAFDMVVVVGSTQHNTVIFTGDIKNVVFSPYWNVPSSILKKEVLPGIKRNKNYLASHNMEWNGNSVRQKPGPKNSLGLVKFLFPNSYDIYFHDTPSKSLFGESSRAFSHGCIRLAEPKKMASWILRNDNNWNDAKITAAMNSGKEKFVVVKQKLPVFIGYFTAWVDRNGKLNFRDDIYGHDKKMMDQLFGKK